MDTELVRRAQGGDREAFAALVPPAVERLLPVAFQILGDSDLAEEATHIAVINAWRKLPSLREPVRFEAWLYRLVVNACRDEVRVRDAPLPVREEGGGYERARRDRGHAIDLVHHAVRETPHEGPSPCGGERS